MKLGFFRSLAVLLIALGALVAADALWRFATKFRFDPRCGPEYRYSAIDVVAAHVALLEKPGARTALVVGERASSVAGSLAAAGVACDAGSADRGSYSLVFATGRSGADWKRLSESAIDGGALAWLFDVRGLSARRLRAMMEDFPCEDAHLWMIGEDDWMLTGRTVPCRIRLDAMLEMFAAGSSMEELAAASCDSLPELFAGYAGARADVMPAFESGDIDADVRPEFFLTKEIPEIRWIDAGGADGDIGAGVMREIRSMQVVRRLVVSGNMLAVEGKPEEAVDRWAAAMLRNPHDTMLLDRLYRLAVNASAFEKVGNVVAAAKCYETMASVRPNDIAALRRYAACMRRLGQAEIADAAERRASELRR